MLASPAASPPTAGGAPPTHAAVRLPGLGIVNVALDAPTRTRRSAPAPAPAPAPASKRAARPKSSSSAAGRLRLWSGSAPWVSPVVKKAFRNARQRRALRVELRAEVALHARAGRVDVGRQAPLGGVEERRAGEERLLVGRRRRRCGGRGARRRRRRRGLRRPGGVDDDLQRIDGERPRVALPRQQLERYKWRVERLQLRPEAVRLLLLVAADRALVRRRCRC